MLTITKKNGKIVVYDRGKIAESILRANREAENEMLCESSAKAIADSVIGNLVATQDIIFTQDIRNGVYAALRERGFVRTAEKYIGGSGH